MNKSITHADFNSAEAIETQKLIDYYEDDQERYVVEILDKKRADWRERGFNVQSRNIIKRIVDESGLLFVDFHATVTHHFHLDLTHPGS